MAFHALPIGACLRVCLVTDAQGQTMYEKVAQSQCVWETMRRHNEAPIHQEGDRGLW